MLRRYVCPGYPRLAVGPCHFEPSLDPDTGKPEGVYETDDPAYQRIVEGSEYFPFMRVEEPGGGAPPPGENLLALSRAELFRRLQAAGIQVPEGRPTKHELAALLAGGKG